MPWSPLLVLASLSVDLSSGEKTITNFNRSLLTLSFYTSPGGLALVLDRLLKLVTEELSSLSNNLITDELGGLLVGNTTEGVLGGT